MKEDFTYTWLSGETTLTTRMPLCVFMYDNFHLQVMVSMIDGGEVAVHDHEKVGATSTEEEVIALVHTVKLVKCKRKKGCERMAFDPATCETNRKGYCEKCFMELLDKKYLPLIKKEQEEARLEDQRQLANGATHKVVAWIHGGGDDVEAVIYTRGCMSKEQIQAELKKEGSKVLGDYRIQDLMTGLTLNGEG